MNKTYSYKVLKDFLDGDLEQIKDITETFIISTPDILNELKASLDSKNWDQLSKDAHKLKSSVKLYEISDVVEEILFIEKKATELKDFKLLEEKYKFISERLNKVIDQLQKDVDDWDLISKEI